MAVDADAMNMVSEDARLAMAILDQAGQDLTTQWSAAHSVIVAASGQVGSDLLASAFMRSYEPRAGSIAKTMGQLAPVSGLLATAGHRGIDDYEAADTAAAGYFRRTDHG